MASGAMGEIGRGPGMETRDSLFQQCAGTGLGIGECCGKWRPGSMILVCLTTGIDSSGIWRTASHTTSNLHNIETPPPFVPGPSPVTALSLLNSARFSETTRPRDPEDLGASGRCWLGSGKRRSLTATAGVSVGCPSY